VKFFYSALLFIVCAGLLLTPGGEASKAYAADKKPKRPTATFETTMGTFTIELFDDLAPKTCKSFMDLANRKFYDGIIFHRVIDGFMIQGGDPTGTGTGGPGYKIPDEFGEGLTHDSPGILSMANSGPNTGGSQFFITLAPTPWLDGKHAIFGKVTSGMDVVEAIGKVKTGPTDKPVTSVVINKLHITAGTADKDEQ
jgi:cyclophilin family peptidyl-prolyl cis-trans isomerase